MYALRGLLASGKSLQNRPFNSSQLGGYDWIMKQSSCSWVSYLPHFISLSLSPI